MYGSLPPPGDANVIFLLFFHTPILQNYVYTTFSMLSTSTRKATYPELQDFSHFFLTKQSKSQAKRIDFSSHNCIQFQYTLIVTLCNRCNTFLSIILFGNIISVNLPGFASKNVSKKHGFKVFRVFVFMFRAQYQYQQQ